MRMASSEMEAAARPPFWDLEDPDEYLPLRRFGGHTASDENDEHILFSELTKFKILSSAEAGLSKAGNSVFKKSLVEVRGRRGRHDLLHHNLRFSGDVGQTSAKSNQRLGRFV